MAEWSATVSGLTLLRPGQSQSSDLIFRYLGILADKTSASRQFWLHQHVLPHDPAKPDFVYPEPFCD